MTTHANDSGRSEDASDVSEDDVHDVLVHACNADGVPYELTTHYLFYGPRIPSDWIQAGARVNSRETLREHIILDYRLIE